MLKPFNQSSSIIYQWGYKMLQKKSYPSDLLPNSFKSSSVNVVCVFPRWILNMVTRACSSGRGIYIRLSNLLRMAESSTQGILVAPNTKIPSVSWPTPSRNQFLKLESFAITSKLKLKNGTSIFININTFLKKIYSIYKLAYVSLTYPAFG